MDIWVERVNTLGHKLPIRYKNRSLNPNIWFQGMKPLGKLVNEKYDKPCLHFDLMFRQPLCCQDQKQKIFR